MQKRQLLNICKMYQKIIFISTFSIFIFLMNARSYAQEALAETGVRMSLLTEEIYKVANPGRYFRTENWMATILFQGVNIDEIEAVNLRLEFYSEHVTVKQSVFGMEFFASGQYTYRALQNTVALPIIFRENVTLKVDEVSINVEVTMADDTYIREFEFLVQSYEPKTDFIFPLPGNSLITAAGYYDGGHDGNEQLYAIDLIGLDVNYAPTDPTHSEDQNGNMAGWEREIIAPAGGIVVDVENNIPDQVSPNSYSEDLYQRDDGTRAVGGNSIVIDHGNGEYSVLMHLKNGSISVGVGDRVQQGQKIAQMGNSGDSYGAHLHFHVQNSPDLLSGLGLPMQFSNMQNSLTRGRYITIE